MIRKWPSKTVAFIKRRRIAVASVFTLLLIITVYFVSIHGISYEGQNSKTFQGPGYNLTVVPVDIYDSPLGSTAQFQVFGEINGTLMKGLSITVSAGADTFNPPVKVINNGGFMRIYVPLGNNAMSHGSALVSISSGNKTLFTVEEHIIRTPVPLEIEALIAASGVLYLMTLASWDFSGRRIILMVTPVYVLLAAFMGQRYDTFFMITSGIRFIDGVNPFIVSGFMPPSLKWEYPPLFIPYSMLSYILMRAFGLHTISNGMLNYPGTVSGFTYMAWRSFSGPFLLPYYAIVKLPMILSTIAIYFLLVKYSPVGKGNAVRFWILNPYVIVVGVIWGQLDVISSFLLLASLIKLKHGKTGVSALLCGLGTGFKIFPVFLIPGIIRESRNKLRDSTIFAASLLPNAILYILGGSIIKPLYTLFYSRSVPTFYGVFSSNGISWQYVLKLLGVSSFPSLFLYAFIPFYLIFTVLFLRKRGERDYLRYMLVVIFAFFLSYNYTNPQYFVWVLPLLIYEGEYLVSVIMSAIPLGYLIITYNLAYFINPYLSYNYFSSLLGQVESLKVTYLGSVLVSFIMISNACLLYLLMRGIGRIRAEGSSSAP